MRNPSPLLRLKLLIDSFGGAVVGAGAYGAWATYVNWDSGSRVALGIGATHWLASTFLTYTGTGVMRRAFMLGSHEVGAVIVAAVGGLVYTYLVLLGIHLAIGTSHLLLTLAAGAIPNLLFCGSYALLLARTMRAEDFVDHGPVTRPDMWTNIR